jgi:multisubunit Na+/H+ antiporter MnhC subunit
MNTRSFISWIVWALFVLAAFLWIAHEASGKTRRTQPPTQGSGAAALMAKPVPGPSMLVLPKIVIKPQSFYFVATAQAGGLESTNSNEVVYVRTNTSVQWVTLAWNRSPTLTTITNYMVYKGRVSGVYTNAYPAGTNLTLRVPLFPPVLTNVVINVTTTGATNLAYASSLAGPWVKVGATNWTATNPPSPRYFRSMKAGSRVYISSIWQ